jgi:hypothetical protein
MSESKHLKQSSHAPLARQSESDLLDERLAAEYLSLRPGTLSVWRCTKRYPLRYIKLGARVRYRRRDLDAFLEARTVR